MIGQIVNESIGEEVARKVKLIFAAVVLGLTLLGIANITV